MFPTEVGSRNGEVRVGGGKNRARRARGWETPGPGVAGLLAVGAAVPGLVGVLLAHPGLSAESLSASLVSAGAWGPVLFVLAAALRPMVLLPSQIFSATAGALWGGLNGSLIALAGSWLSTLLVVLLGGKLLRRPLARLSGKRRAELEQVAHRHDFLYGLVMALNPLLPTDLALAAAAGAGARPTRLLAGALIGAVPQTITTAMFGGALTQEQPWMLALSGAAMAVGLAGGGWVAHGVWRTLRPTSARPPVGALAQPEPARAD